MNSAGPTSTRPCRAPEVVRPLMKPHAHFVTQMGTCEPRKPILNNILPPNKEELRSQAAKTWSILSCLSHCTNMIQKLGAVPCRVIPLGML